MLSRVRVKFSPDPTMLEPTFLEVAGGVFEVSADGFLNLLAGVEQPEDDEERHHGGDEIGIGDFPGAAVMAAVATFFLEDDDGASFVHVFLAGDAQRWQRRRPLASSADGKPASSSLNEGRTWPGTARRATSTAMMGAVPFRKETMRTRMT